MSEYQYYEFQAIDRPLSDQEQVEIRRLSSRVEPTRTSAVFTYSYGDFHGDPLKVLERYFDALLYVANWGSKQLAFRFPRECIDMERLAPYCSLEEISLEESEQHAILSIAFLEEGGGEWIEGEGLLASMVALREDILSGDMRALYLAWLKAAPNLQDWVEENPEDEDDDYDEGSEEASADGEEEEGDDLVEPPVPPGMRQLSSPLTAFVTFLAIDADLIAVAAEASPPLEAVADRFAEWLPLLSEEERTAFLLRVAMGEPGVHVQLVRRLREAGGEHGRGGPAPNDTPRRTLATLLGAASERRQRRKEIARQKAAQERRAWLERLAENEPAVWSQVMAHIERKQPKAYDEAITLLRELRALADYQGQRAQFAERIAALQTNYHSRPALLERLRRLL